MDERSWIVRHGFWVLALLWLPAGVAAQAAVRFPPDAGLPGDPHFLPAVLTAAGSLVLAAPCGLPLALGCRRIWRLRYRRGLSPGWGSAPLTAASLVAGLLGPAAIAVYAIGSACRYGGMVVAGTARLTIAAVAGPAAQPGRRIWKFPGGGPGQDDQLGAECGHRNERCSTYSAAVKCCS